MHVTVKRARNTVELFDAFALRYSVFTEERGKFAEHHTRLIVDIFDAVRSSTIFTAYVGDEAIGTIRVNEDTCIGLPADWYLGPEIRESIPFGVNICGISMFAIRQDKRHQRSVIFGLFNAVVRLLEDLKCTHILAAISTETTPIYLRMGFEPVGMPEWVEEIGDEILPILAEFKTANAWFSSKSRRK